MITPRKAERPPRERTGQGYSTRELRAEDDRPQAPPKRRKAKPLPKATPR